MQNVRGFGMKRLAQLLLLTMLVAALSACQPARMYLATHYIYDVFDTAVCIKGYAESEAQLDAYFAMAEERFQELHRLFDIYHDYPGLVNLKTINDAAGGEALSVAEEIVALLELAQEGYQRSGGLVDVTMEPVLRIWHDLRLVAEAYPERAALPEQALLEAANALTGMDGLELDSVAHTVRLQRPGMALNVGAVAKGFAAELVAEQLQEAGWTSFLIDAGGNIKAVGRPADGRKRWGVGLQDPDVEALPGQVASETMYYDVAYVHDTSVVSSGDYARRYYVEGEAYHHLIDPRTLWPGRLYRAVYVLTSHSGWADLYSTALFFMEPEEALRFAETNDLAVYLIRADGSVVSNQAMKAELKSEGATSDSP